MPAVIDDDVLTETDTETRTRRQPPYAIVVYNDHDHTYQFVMAIFAKVFKYPVEKCFKLAEQIDKQGRAVVWIGALEPAELHKEQIESLSKSQDPWAAKKVQYPLKVDLEPTY